MSSTTYHALFCFFSEALAMGKLHKEIGNFIVQAAEDTDHTDAQVVKVSNKNKY